MEDIIEEQLEAILPTLITGLLSGIFANLVPILLIFLVIVVMILFFILKTKHNYTTRVRKRAIQLHQETAAQISGVIVSSKSFRDLELGLAEGETAGRLSFMQETAMTLHKQSQELSTKLQDFRPSFFSIIEPSLSARKLEKEVKDLHMRVQRYVKDLSGIGQSVKRSNQEIRQLEIRLETIKKQLDQLGSATEYPLVAIRKQFEQATLICTELGQLAAFDSLKAQQEMAQASWAIDSLQQRMDELHRSMSLLQEMRARVQQHEEQVIRRMKDNQDPAGLKEPSGIYRSIDPILEQADTALRTGRSIDLRAVALEIESILGEAAG